MFILFASFISVAAMAKFLALHITKDFPMKLEEFYSSLVLDDKKLRQRLNEKAKQKAKPQSVEFCEHFILFWTEELKDKEDVVSFILLLTFYCFNRFITSKYKHRFFFHWPFLFLLSTIIQHLYTKFFFHSLTWYCENYKVEWWAFTRTQRSLFLSLQSQKVKILVFC